LNLLYLGVLVDSAVRFLLILEKLPLQGRGWRSGSLSETQKSAGIVFNFG
jgi:hypothetical protein